MSRAFAMYQRVDFSNRSLQYERSYRAEIARFFRFHKERPGNYRRKAEKAGWGMPHDKANPGRYRQPYKRRNDYVRWQD